MIWQGPRWTWPYRQDLSGRAFKGILLAGLRAEKRNLTVLFGDIRGFTSISERLPPEAVVATLNEHLNMMVSVIFKHPGTLGKFVGDCVMAFWGAPLAQPNHAELAARAALDMIEGLEKLNQK